MTSQTLPQHDAAESTRLYRAIWRWHFYAGLIVVPFLLMLAITGAFMMMYSDLSNEMGWTPKVNIQDKTLEISEQAKAALASVPEGTLVKYIAPRATDLPAFFEIKKGEEGIFSVAVDPYTAKVLTAHDKGSTWRAFAEKIHGTLLLGDVGDRIVEAASSLAVVLIVTGLYMWWPRQKTWRAALFPRLSTSGRAFWKDLHSSVGAWMSVFLLLFMLSGLAWAGVWGGKFVQPWSSFPASKYDNVPLSDETHKAMNHDILHEVPWPLEQTPMPASGSDAGTQAVAHPVVLDTVAAWARGNGFTGQFKLAVPADEKGVYTVSSDGMDQDSSLPTADRFVHIDQFTGKILADLRYADYPAMGKVMAWGIALHKGLAGRMNFLFNLVYLSLVVMLCVSGIVMWWKRRPVGRLAAPRYPNHYRPTAAVAGIAVVLGALFPMGGLAIMAFAVIDFLLPKRLKEVGVRA